MAGDAKPGLVEMRDRADSDSLLDHSDRIGRQARSFPPRGGHTPGRHHEVEHINKRGGRASVRRPRPEGQRAFNLGREYSGSDRITRALFLDPVIVHRLRPDGWQISDSPLRGNNSGNEVQLTPSAVSGFVAQNPIKVRRRRQSSTRALGLFPLRLTRRLAKQLVAVRGLAETVAAGWPPGVLRLLIKPGTQRRVLLLEAVNPSLQRPDCFLMLFSRGIICSIGSATVRGNSPGVGALTNTP